MREQWTKLAWIALAIMLIVVGCSPSATQSPPTPVPPTQPPSPTFPIGIFAKGNWTWEFKADGSYVSQSPDAKETGVYTVTGNQIVVKGDYCGDVKGTYTWVYDGKALSFKAIDDKCSDRLGVVKDGQWLKKP